MQDTEEAELDVFDLEKRVYELFESAVSTITSGTDESSVRLRPEIAVEDYRFTVLDLDEEITYSRFEYLHGAASPTGSGEVPHTVRERLYDLTAYPVRVTLRENGSIVLTFAFEDDDYELVGEFDVNVHHPQAFITFPLGVTEDAVVSGRPTAEFDFDVDLDVDRAAGDFTRRDFVTKVQWAIDDYIDDVRESVRSGLSMALDRDPVHQSIDDVFASEVGEVLSEDARLVGVGRVVQGDLVVKYIVI